MISLQVILDQKILFESDGKWLYPLFDLEEFVKTHSLTLTKAFVRDKVIGKAAALLLVRLGAGRIHGEVMSQLAVDTLTDFSVRHSYDLVVPRIECQTEMLLLDIDDPNEAYQLLCRRARRC